MARERAGWRRRPHKRPRFTFESSDMSMDTEPEMTFDIKGEVDWCEVNKDEELAIKEEMDEN